MAARLVGREEARDLARGGARGARCVGRARCGARRRGGAGDARAGRSAVARGRRRARADDRPRPRRVRRRRPARLGEEGRWFHYGLTSSDVVDTGLALAGAATPARCCCEGLERALAAVVARAEEHRATLCIGRTHGVHAEPTTFGLKLAGWAFELDRDRDAAAPRAGRDARRQALRRGRQLLRDRPGARADRLRAARPRAGAGLDADPAARPARGAARRRSRSSPRRSTGSRRRSATSRAPRCARSRSRSAPARRARRRCRTSATRSPPSGSAGSPASCARTRSSASRTSRSGTSATSRTRRPSGSSSPTRSSPSTTCSTGSPGSSTASSSARADAREPRREPRPLLQPAAAARARRVGPAARRGVPARAASTRCAPGTRGSTSATLVDADAEIAGRVDLDAVFDLGAYTRHVDVVFDRLHALTPTGGGRACLRRSSTSRAGRSASSSRSTTSGCCSSPATGSRPSTSSCRPRSPTRAACSPGCRRSGSPARATSSPNHLLGLRADGRSTECRRLEMLPLECVVRGYLAGSGWKDYQRDRLDLAGTPCRRACASRTGCRSRSSRRRRRRPTGHDENIDAEQAAALVGEERLRGSRARRRSSSTGSRRSTRPRAGS